VIALEAEELKNPRGEENDEREAHAASGGIGTGRALKDARGDRAFAVVGEPRNDCGAKGPEYYRWRNEFPGVDEGDEGFGQQRQETKQGHARGDEREIRHEHARGRAAGEVKQHREDDRNRGPGQ